MNIINLLDEHQIPNRTQGHEHCRRGWVQIDCPFCSRNSHHYRMGINIQYLYANCWHCGAKPLPSLLVELLRIRFTEAQNLLKTVSHDRIPERKTTHQGHYTEPSGVTQLLNPHEQYLRRRGFDPSEIKRLWGIRGIGIAPKLAWRLFIPILFHGVPVSWTTRSIGKTSSHKYISASPEEESMPHKHILYGIDYCRHAIVVCEGPLDVWAIGPGAVATFGIDYLSKQVELIAKYPIRAICYDAESDAQKRARNLAHQLESMPGETYNIVLDSKDPGDATYKEIKRIRQEILK